MNDATAIGARGWAMFAVMIVLSGVTYLFIARALDTFSPPAVVVGRTLGAAAILLPFAVAKRALAPAWRRIGWVLLFAALSLGIPFGLLTVAQEALPSELSALLLSTVPLFGMLVAVVLGSRAMVQPVRLTGLALGFVGVTVALSGPGLAIGPSVGLVAVGGLLVAAASHATGPFIIARRLTDVPALGTITLALAAVGLAYLPIALVTPGGPPTLRAMPLLAPGEPTYLPSVIALALLAMISTSASSLVYFALIRAVGPARTSIYAYATPLVAIVVGIVVLGEPASSEVFIGLPIVLAGCWLAATGGLPHRRAHDVDRP